MLRLETGCRLVASSEVQEVVGSEKLAAINKRINEAASIYAHSLLAAEMAEFGIIKRESYGQHSLQHAVEDDEALAKLPSLHQVMANTTPTGDDEA